MAMWDNHIITSVIVSTFVLKVLDKLQGCDGTSGEPSQQHVAVVQMDDDKCLD
jgi:hypothetical protein